MIRPHHEFSQPMPPWPRMLLPPNSGIDFTIRNSGTRMIWNGTSSSRMK